MRLECTAQFSTPESDEGLSIGDEGFANPASGSDGEMKLPRDKCSFLVPHSQGSCQDVFRAGNWISFLSDFSMASLPETSPFILGRNSFFCKPHKMTVSIASSLFYTEDRYATKKRSLP